MKPTPLVKISRICGVVILVTVFAYFYQPFADFRKTGLPIQPFPKNVAFYGTDGEPRTVTLVKLTDAEVARLENARTWGPPKAQVWYNEIPWYRDLIFFPDFARLLESSNSIQESVKATYGVFSGGSWTAILDNKRKLLWIDIEYAY